MESAESLLRDQIPAAAKVNESTKMALQDAVLSPVFTLLILMKWIKPILMHFVRNGMS